MQPPSDVDPFLAPAHSRPDFGAMSRKGWKLRPFEKIKCGLCGKERETKLPNATKWCSNACNWYARRNEGAYDRDLNCIVCGKGYRVRPNRGKRYRRTCSRECRNAIVGQKNARLKDEDILLIRQMGQDGQSQRSIARQFGCSQNVVCGILGGRSFRWVPASSTKELDVGCATEGRQGPPDALPITAQAP